MHQPARVSRRAALLAAVAALGSLAASRAAGQSPSPIPGSPIPGSPVPATLPPFVIPTLPPLPPTPPPPNRRPDAPTLYPPAAIATYIPVPSLPPPAVLPPLPATAAATTATTAAAPGTPTPRATPARATTPALAPPAAGQPALTDPAPPLPPPAPLDTPIQPAPPRRAEASTVSTPPNPAPPPRPMIALGATITEDIYGTATMAQYLRNYTQVVGGIPKSASLQTSFPQYWENGLTTAVLNFYSQWPTPFIPNPPIPNNDGIKGQLNVIYTLGSVPMISWNTTDIRFTAITGGGYNDYLTTYADAVAAWNKPVIMRFNWEMNGNFFGWGRWLGTGTSGQGPDDATIAQRYVDMWRHVVQLFRDRGATNVRWVWCPNIINTGPAPSYPNGTGPPTPVAVDPTPFYPGDRYVDWLGMDGYNYGRFDQWKSFADVFAPTYQTLVNLPADPLVPSGAKTQRPMLIGETGSEHGTYPGYIRSEADWIRGMTRDLLDRFQRIHCVLWYNIDKRFEESNTPDWRIVDTTRFYRIKPGSSPPKPEYTPAPAGYIPGSDPDEDAALMLPPSLSPDPCTPEAIIAYKEMVLNPYFQGRFA